MGQRINTATHLHTHRHTPRQQTYNKNTRRNQSINNYIPLRQCAKAMQGTNTTTNSRLYEV